jgi:hypothetical protein
VRQQIGNVRADNEQQEADGPEQRQKRRPQLMLTNASVNVMRLIPQSLTSGCSCPTRTAIASISA